MIEKVKETKVRIYDKNDNTRLIMFRLFKNNNKFKYSIYELDDLNNPVVDSDFKYFTFKEANIAAFHIIDKEFSTKEEYDTLEGLGINYSE